MDSGKLVIRMPHIFCLFALCTLVAIPAHAQTTSLSGTVTDAAGAAAPGASKAVKDYHPDGCPLTRDPKGKGTYSPTGIWGDPTLASRAEGEKLVEALVDGVLREIEALKRQPLR